MKTLSFLIIVISAGFFAGLIHSFLNIALVEPYLDNAIGIENQRLFAEGQAKDTPQFWKQFSDYRIWQKQGSIISGVILGMATGSLFGLVFAYSRKRLPGKNDIYKALFLAGIMWATLYFIPFLKYPANPPTVGDPNTITFRAIAYLMFVALSGFGALGFSKMFQRLQHKKFLVVACYAIFMVIVFFVMPKNPDPVDIPQELVDGFRIISSVTVTMSWIVNAIILGWLWKKFQPDSVVE